MANRALRNTMFRLIPAVLTVAAWLAVLERDAAAQRPPYSTFQINKIIATPGPLSPQNKQILDKYFDKWFLSRFYRPQKPNDLPILRNKIYKVVVKGAPKTPAHDYVNNKILRAMSKVIGSPKANRALKYNAMLLIAELNDSDALRNVKPMPGAYRLLLLANNQPQSWDYLKPAVFIGLARIAATPGGIPKKDVPKLTEKMLTILQQDEPPAGRTAATHDFFRRGAASVLAAMGNTGPNDSVVKAFAKIAADPSNRPSLRCEMARFIGQLKYPPNTKVDRKQLANILGYQVVEVCLQQIAPEETANDGKQPAAVPDGAAARQTAMYAIDSCNSALQALSEANADSFIYDLKKKLDGIQRQLDDADEIADSGVVDFLADQMDSVKGLLLEKPQIEPRVASDVEQESTEQASAK